MPPQSSDDELKLNRRVFLQHSAAVTAMTASVTSIATKTDALAQQPPLRENGGGRGDGMPYPYT